MGRFQDQVVWITGASAGIGRALALAFAGEGAHVAVSARRQDRLDGVVDEIQGLDRQALAVTCDVTDEGQIALAVDATVEHFGRLDVAIANAGFGVVGDIATLSADDWRRQLEVNVVGLTQTVRYALDPLRKTGGRLALLGSAAAMIPAPGAAAYAASKAAVRSIGQSLSVELAGTEVSCTTLHPGFVASEITQVDNRGVHHAERRDPRPAKLIWPTDRAAGVMLRAIHRRKREVVFTGHGRIAAFLGRHWPALLHVAMSRSRRAKLRQPSA